MELEVSTVINEQAQTPVSIDVCACLVMAANVAFRASLSAINLVNQGFTKSVPEKVPEKVFFGYFLYGSNVPGDAYSYTAKK